MKTDKKTIENFLEKIRRTHFKLHKDYEKLFWISYMGDQSVDNKKNKSLEKRDEFFSDLKIKEKVDLYLKNVKNKKQKESLLLWKNFFEINITPSNLMKLKKQISELEDKMVQKMAKRKEGYVDPYTKKFIKKSHVEMGMMIRTNDDEKIRKACFEANNKLAYTNIKEYIKFVSLLNEYANGMGYEDFYAFKIQQEEGMTKTEVFKIFDDIYEKTKYSFEKIKKIEKKNKGLRKAWNFGYLMSGDFTKLEDQYFPFDESLERWGKSFKGLGVDFAGGKIQLDLLDRKGKYANGFCHWPDLVHYKNNKRIPGSSNFTCNVVYGQVGAAVQGYNTLFHEGGHSAHLLNSTEKDTCINSEYPPMSTAWAETQSMFMDTIFSTYEWKSRYAKNKDGEIYPLDLFEKKVNKLNIITPTSLNMIIAVCKFEKEIYESKNLTEEKVIKIAKKIFKKYTDLSGNSLWLLNVPHIYSWTSCCAYQGYGLADIALHQWREYFKNKYGHIVDNPNIGKEMKKVWKLGAKISFKEFVKKATGKDLSAEHWIKNHTKNTKDIITEAKESAKKLKSVRKVKKVNFNADIKMVSGKEIICTNRNSFEHMAQSYSDWLNK